MKIAFIHHTDIRTDNDSITNYTRAILEFNSDHKEHEIDCYGVSRFASEKQMVANQGNSNFHVVFTQPPKRFFPSTLKYILRFWVKRSNLSLKGKLLVSNYHEWAFPFLYPWKTGPSVLIIHGVPKQHFRIICKSKVKIWLRDWMERLVLRRIDKAIVVSRDAYNFYVGCYPHLKDKFVFIPTFVDGRFFFPMENKSQLRKHFGFNGDDIILIYTGRLELGKGLDLLLRSFRLLKDKYKLLKLVLVGDGSLRTELEEMVMDQELNNIVFLGPLKHREMPEILNCADLFVLASASEGTSLAVLEAIACGVPVISFDVGDMGEVIKEGRNGYLVSDRSDSALANAIIRGLERRYEMQEQCPATIQDYRASKVIPRILQLFSEVWQQATDCSEKEECRSHRGGG